MDEDEKEKEDELPLDPIEAAEEPSRAEMNREGEARILIIIIAILIVALAIILLMWWI